MPATRLAEKRIWVGDESRVLLSGEVHYWRLDPSVWREVLQRARDLGLDVVSCYVCWEFHEVGVADFDFVGRTNPRRDLLAFLRLAAEMEFWVLLRPGPYIYAEWPYSGVPERVVRWHRLHPRFIDEAKVWLAAVVDAFKSHLATNGGPIVLVQADNEADPWWDVYGAQIGLGDRPGLFQEFLRGRYAHTLPISTWRGPASTLSLPTCAPCSARIMRCSSRGIATRCGSVTGTQRKLFAGRRTNTGASE